MRVSDLIEGFGIYTTNEEGKLLTNMTEPRHLKSYSDHDRVVIENMIRKGLVVKIGHNHNPIVVANEY